MARRGTSAIEVVVGLLLGLLVAYLVIKFLGMGGGAFKDTFTCPAEDPQYACFPRSDGCPDNYKMVVWKYYGCEVDDQARSQLCCMVSSTGKDGATGTNAPKPPPSVTLRGYTFEKGKSGEVLALTPINNGKNLPILVGREQYVMLDAQVANCDKCATTQTTLTLRAKTKAGQDVLRQIAQQVGVTGKKNIGNPITLPGDDAVVVLPITTLDIGGWVKGGFDRNLLIKVDDKYINEIITLTAHFSIPETQPPAGGGPVKNIESDFTIFLNVKPAVRYGGLTQKWEQRKTISAVCESPVSCKNVYFRITQSGSLGAGEMGPPTPPSCPLPTPDELKTVKTLEQSRKWCVLDENGKSQVCLPTQNDCIAALGVSNDEQYTAAFQLFKKELEKGSLPPELAVLWNQQEGRVSRRSCQPDMTLTTEGDGGLRLFKAEQPDPAVDRWSFTLDMPYMQNQYLCVYGQDKFVDGTFYPAGDPQQIRIDKTPPMPRVEFKPMSLTLQFYCEDTASGCDDTKRSIGYISDIQKFFPALFSGSPQSAAQWCPGASFKVEQRQQMLYTDEALRVLCVRATDNAGNTGYAMVTVYNTYQAAAALLSKYAQDQAEKQRTAALP